MRQRTLIAVITCHRFRARADAQRSTWVPQVRGADVRFFIGKGEAARLDEVILDVADDYLSLPFKVRAAFRWALDRGYDHVFKTDDDVYIQPARLIDRDSCLDYVGPRSLGSSPVPYASGFAHWLSHRAMEVLVDADIDDWAEDRWTGAALARAGIKLHIDPRFTLIHAFDHKNVLTGTEGPLLSNDVIAVGELDPELMKQVHAEWVESELTVIAAPSTSLYP